MITTDTYPELDQAHADALFRAIRQTIRQSLHDVAALAAGGSKDDVGLLRFLPGQYLNRYDADFAQRFAVTLSTVAWKLAEPSHVSGLASTAEELALKYIVETARRLLPANVEDGQFDELEDQLFEDDLFREPWDGGSEIAPFDEWFTPYRQGESLHPFIQTEAGPFLDLWTGQQQLGDDDLEDPATEVFIAMGEDWMAVPDNVTDQIPAVLADTAAVLYPERGGLRALNASEREHVYENAAQDVQALLQSARSDEDVAYDVWLVRSRSGGGKTRQRLHAGLPLQEALTLRSMERMGEYRGNPSVELRVYPEGHAFPPDIRDVSGPA